MLRAACPRGLKAGPPGSMVGCLSRIGLSSTPGDWFQFSFYFVTWLQLLFFFCEVVDISVFPRTSGSSAGTFLAAGREADFPLWGCIKG